jgi:alpha/beta superfamily hydrolase
MTPDFFIQNRAITIVSLKTGSQIEVFYENPHRNMVPKQIILLLHPHPLYGGNWHNKLITTMARAAHTQGYATIRPHFSSVGRTPGPFTGMAQQHQLIMELYQEILPFFGPCIAAAGFSFGAGVLLSLDIPDLARFVVAPSWSELKKEITLSLPHQKKVCVVHAQDDTVVPITQSLELMNLIGINHGYDWHYLSEGNHFFQHYESIIEKLFQLFLSRLSCPDASRNCDMAVP